MYYSYLILLNIFNNYLITYYNIVKCVTMIMQYFNRVEFYKNIIVLFLSSAKYTLA